MSGLAPRGDQRSGLGRVIAVVAVVVVWAALVGVLEAPIVSVSCTTQGTELLVQTNTVASTVTYTTSSPVTQPRTQTVQVLNINPTAIPPNQAAVASANLTASTSLAIVWTATSAVNVYLLDSSQHQSYSGTGAPAQSLGSTLSMASGKLLSSIPTNDTYYLVIVNLASQSANLYSASGVATFNGNVTTFSTVTTSSVTSVAQTSTSTSTTTSTYQRTTNLLGQGSACSS